MSSIQSKVLFMNYKETLDFLFSQLPMFQNIGERALNNKLDKSLQLDAYFGHPHHAYKCIHVGGTNGKGSVSHLIASVLQSAGYKVGLYTSPHLKDFRERIKVNGVSCVEEFVVDFVKQHTLKLQELKPSFFEMTVAMAFQYFKDQEVDIAVVEVGLGGRFDSTNIITPILSVITNISIDHTSLLGDTLSEIAVEKAGIIKENTPVVIGEWQEEIYQVFKQKAMEKQTSLCYADNELRIDNVQQSITEVAFSWGDIPEIHCPLSPNYQLKNIQTALIAVQKLQEVKSMSVADKDIVDGFANVIKQTQLKGRWQVLQTQPLMICDTGHNEAGIRMAMAELKKVAHRYIHFVYGTSNDKDLRTILPLLPIEAKYYFTQAQVPRAMQTKELKAKAKKYGLEGECFTTVRQAVDCAVERAGNEDVIYVGGSIFVVAELDL